MNHDFPALYEKYGAELRAVCLRLRSKIHEMHQAGYRAVFGDVEGELLYLMIRETKPKMVFEISPAAGYSTNYMLAALTANGTGELHSFELTPETNGIPTGDVIRGNLMEGLELNRFHLHIGDAQKTTLEVPGTIDFCLMDSCHEGWFAKWYVENIFPRVKGDVMVQDIAFHDRLEAGTEAEYVWAWAKRVRLPLRLVGQIELELNRTGARSGLAERRAFECNSLIFTLPQQGEAELPPFDVSPDELIQQAEECQGRKENRRADELLSGVMIGLHHCPRRGNLHRLFLRMGRCYAQMGEMEQAMRCNQRALGVVMGSEPPQRAKGLREMWRKIRGQGLHTLAFQILIIMLMDRVFNRKSWNLPR